jgi:hypothetical protein
MGNVYVGGQASRSQVIRFNDVLFFLFPFIAYVTLFPSICIICFHVAIITVHILSHRVYLFSFLRQTHLLWGLYSYDWYHCMYLIGSASFSLFLL